MLFSATQCTGLDELHCVALVEEIERAIEEMSIYETANPSGTTDGASVAGSVVGVHEPQGSLAEPFVGDRPAADRRGVLITGLAVVAIVGLIWRKSTLEDGLLAPSPPPPPPPPLSNADVNRLELVSSAQQCKCEPAGVGVLQRGCVWSAWMRRCLAHGSWLMLLLAWLVVLV